MKTLHSVTQKRSRVTHEAWCWEIDEFFGDNEGLFFAEFELESEEQPFEPPWLGKEVTTVARYYSANLVQHIFSKC